MNDLSAIPIESAPPAIAQRLQAISEPSRARIVAYLGDGERCVCDLGAALGLSPALASHHLRTLHASGLIRERRAGRWVYYSLDPQALEELGGWFDQLLTRTRAAAVAAARPDCDFDPAATGVPPSHQPLETR